MIPRFSTVQLIDDLVNHWSMPPEILIVDDDAAVIEILTEILSGLGLKVTSAQTGEEAILRYREMYGHRFQDTGATAHPFDIIFLDVKLPGMSGIDVLREVRKLWPPQPVVVISGSLESLYGVASHGPVCIDEKPLTVEGVRLALAMHNIRMPSMARRLTRPHAAA